MKTFDEQAAYGLPYERLIAQTAALLLFPERPDLELFRLPSHSVIDFFLLDQQKPIAALEVKRRSVRSTTYTTTILPLSVYVAALELSHLTVPTFAAILFVDGLYIFDVLRTPSRICYLRDRRGQQRAHRAYPVGEVLRVKLERESDVVSVHQLQAGGRSSSQSVVERRDTCV
jgi:hypothetical protein